MSNEVFVKNYTENEIKHAADINNAFKLSNKLFNEFVELSPKDGMTIFFILTILLRFTQEVMVFSFDRSSLSKEEIKEAVQEYCTSLTNIINDCSY